MSDNTFGAVLVFSVALAICGMGYCQSVERRADSEVQKVKVQAGLCESTWGSWTKCK